MPLEELKLIWTKAVDLLSSPDDSIVPCPGFQSGFAVASAQDPAKPHIVIPLASGEVRCRGCPQYDRLSICSHTVAVAEKKSILWKFLAWYTKNRDKPNFSQAANQGMPDGRGKKGERAPRKQRSKKQGQNPLPTDFVDRLHTVTANTVQPRSAMVQSASIMPPAVQPVVSAAMPLAAMQSTDLTIQPATARQAVPSAAATRQEVPSAATARQAVPSAATVRQAVPSAATVRQEVPSAATDRQAVPSAATARQEVPSAAIARQEVPSSATARQAVQALPSTAMYCMQPTAMQPLSALPIAASQLATAGQLLPLMPSTAMPSTRSAMPMTVTQQPTAGQSAVYQSLHTSTCTQPLQGYNSTQTHHGTPFSIQPFHNGNPFLLIFQHGNIKRCTGCGGLIEKNSPKNLVLQHMERYQYPTGNPFEPVKYTINKERAFYYHARKACLLNRHPYFNTSMVDVSVVQNALREQHKLQLVLELDLFLE